MAKPARSASRGSVGFNQSMSRGQFIRAAGIAGGAVAVAGLGLGGAAKALTWPPTPPYALPVTPNPDPAHIIVISPDYMEVYPVEISSDKYERKTLLERGRQQDPRLSIINEPLLYSTGFSVWLPLSETNPGPPENPNAWDTRKRTLDAMNIEWAANNVAKKTDGSPGTIFMKARKLGDAPTAPVTPFDFGTGFELGVDLPPGYGVLVCNDCVLSGETDSSGQPLTTVANGTGCFIVTWDLGAYLPWIFGYLDEFGNPLPGYFGVQCWHDFAEKATFKDFILLDNVYPSLYTRDGTDITNNVLHLLTYGEASNVQVINQKVNTGGYAPIFRSNFGILFEHEQGVSIVRDCFVSTTGEPADIAVGIVSFTSNVEMTGNEVFIPTPGGIGIQTSSFGQAAVSNNKITVLADGIGLEVDGVNGVYEGNDYTGYYGWENSPSGWDDSMPMPPGWSAALVRPSMVALNNTGCILAWFGSKKNTFNEWKFPLVNGVQTTACGQLMDLGEANSVAGCKRPFGDPLVRQYFNTHRADLAKHLDRAFGAYKGINGVLKGILPHYPWFKR